MKTAFLFPGQGSQYLGMTNDIVNEFSSAKGRLEEAEDILKFKITSVMFQGPMDELKKTCITQPAIFLHSALLADLLKPYAFEASAGHSLGEYSALYASGALSFKDALLLVRHRGNLMFSSGESVPGTMAAIIGLSSEKVESACREASKEGVVVPANYNCPGQVVISGSVEAVRNAMAITKEMGAKLAKELVVSGAFHSPLMEEPKEELKKKLDSTEFNDASTPVYANVTGLPETSGNEIKDLLYRQMTSPVRWDESIRNMISDGVEKFVEIGPGKVLQGLVKRINPDVEISGVDKVEDLKNYL